MLGSRSVRAVPLLVASGTSEERLPVVVAVTGRSLSLQEPDSPRPPVVDCSHQLKGNH